MNEFEIQARDFDMNSESKKNLFYIPEKSGQQSVYLCGNSLGLQPKSTQKYLEEELDVWRKYGVEGHFNHPYNRKWVTIDDIVRAESSRIVGALEDEIVIMNSLTVNLHLMMVSFYKPTTQRFKVIMEAKAFPSDYYAIESHLLHHGVDPSEAIILLSPRNDSPILETRDILECIETHGDSTCLILFSGVQYYTGQLFDICSITAHGRKKVYKYFYSGMFCWMGFSSCSRECNIKTS